MTEFITLPYIFRPYRCKKLIRLGKNNDGGYVVEEDSILKSKTLLSFGIDHDWSFEEDFYNKNKCVVHSYDGSVGPLFFLRKIKLRIYKLLTSPNKDYFEVSKYWFKLPIKFYKFFNIINNTKGPNHYEKFVGNGERYISLDETLNNLPINNDIFLKIDIEGGEYVLLDDILKKEIVFTGIVIEFHEVSKHVEEIENFITILNLKLVHLHINNYASITPDGIPEVMELSFSRNGDSDYFQNKLPHKLDQNNDPDSWSYELSFEIE